MDVDFKSLPLRIRKAIRDDFDRADGEVSKQLKEISSGLGPSITVRPEWPNLWSALQSKDLDQDAFVSKVTQILEVVCRICNDALESPESDELFEGLLTDLKDREELMIRICPETSSNDKLPHATWQPREAQMTLTIPPGIEKSPLGRVTATLHQDVHSILAGRNKGEDTGRTATAAAVSLPQSAKAQQEARIDHSPRPNVHSSPKPLPRINEIRRPQDLLRKPPYNLIVAQVSQSQVVVQCSHSESLVLMEEYFKKYVRNNPDYGEKGNMVEIKLRQAAFGGHERTYDTLIIERDRAEAVTPMLALTFVQEVLGFQRVHTSSIGSSWHFQRLEPFT